MDYGFHKSVMGYEEKLVKMDYPNGQISIRSYIWWHFTIYMQKIQKENLAGPTQSKNLKIYSPLHTSSSEKYLPVTDNVSHIHQDMVWMNGGQACSSKL